MVGYRNVLAQYAPNLVHKFIDLAPSKQNYSFRPIIRVAGDNGHPERQRFPHRERVSIEIRKAKKEREPLDDREDYVVWQWARKVRMIRNFRLEYLTFRLLTGPDDDQPDTRKHLLQFFDSLQHQRDSIFWIKVCCRTENRRVPGENFLQAGWQGLRSRRLKTEKSRDNCNLFRSRPACDQSLAHLLVPTNQPPPETYHPSNKKTYDWAGMLHVVRSISRSKHQHGPAMITHSHKRTGKTA